MTSQDVLDAALVLLVRDVLDRLDVDCTARSANWSG